MAYFVQPFVTVLPIYLSFLAYFRWASFEPTQPTAFPSHRLIQLDTIFCTICFILHGIFFDAHRTDLSAAMFWLCAGDVLTAGILTPLYENAESGFFARIAEGAWKAKISASVVSTLIAIYLFFDRHVTFFGGAPGQMLLTAGFILVGLVSFFKIQASYYILDEIHRITEKNGKALNVTAIFLAGLLGYFCVIYLLTSSPMASTDDTGKYGNVAMLISVVLGAVIRA